MNARSSRRDFVCASMAGLAGLGLGGCSYDVAA